MPDNRTNKRPGPKAPAHRTEAKKPRVHFEKVKAQHTSHWDWDYLPHSELEKILAASRQGRTEHGPEKTSRNDRSKLLAAAIVMAVGAACVALGLYFLL